MDKSIDAKTAKHLNIKALILIFAAALVVLIFVSKTIYTFNMPTVSAAVPFNGGLSKFETSSGMISWSHAEEVYTQVGGKVKDIPVKEGMQVKEGDALIILSFDTKQAQERLDEYEVSKDKLAVDVQNINIKIDKTLSAIKDTEAEKKREVKKAQKHYDDMKILHDEGAASGNELDDAYDELSALTANYDKQLSDYGYELESLKQDLKTKNLDLENLENQIKPYKEAKANGNAVCAPKSGVVQSIAVKRGQSIGDGELAAIIGIGQEFEIECEISADNNFVLVGDTCKMSNSERSLDGVVTAIAPDESVKLVTISVEDGQVTAGETFTVRFEKEFEKKQVLVPNGAVNKDSDGYFVYQIKRRDGILGKEYYAQKLRVYIGDSDDENTAILKGIGFFEPVVEFSDKSFEEGQAIKLKNEGDFFEE